MILSKASGEEVIHLVVGLVLGEEKIDLWGRMNASSVDAQGIGHETVPQSVVDVVEVEVHFLHVLDLIVMVVGIVLEEIVTDMWMSVIMEGDMVIEIVLIVETTSMEVETATSTTGCFTSFLCFNNNYNSDLHVLTPIPTFCTRTFTSKYDLIDMLLKFWQLYANSAGTHLLEIALLVVIGMMSAIVILKMATSKTASTIGILVRGVAVIGMVAEVLAVMRAEVIEIGQALTIAQAGWDDHLPTTAIKIQMYVYQ